MEDKERLFACRHCGQMVKGWNAAHFWFSCGCPDGWDPEEVTDEEYDEAYPPVDNEHIPPFCEICGNFTIRIDILNVYGERYPWRVCEKCGARLQAGETIDTGWGKYFWRNGRGYYFTS